MAKRASLHVACVEYVTLIQFGITLRFVFLQQPVGFSLRPHADWHSDQQPDELDAFASADARAFLLPERIAHDESDGDAHGHAIVRPERQPDRRADKAGLAVLKNQRRLVSRCRCVRRRCGSFSTHGNSSIFCAQRDKESRTGYAGPHRIADLGGNDDAHAVAYAWPHSPADCDSFARANAQCTYGIARLARGPVHAQASTATHGGERGCVCSRLSSPHHCRQGAAGCRAAELYRLGIMC